MISTRLCVYLDVTIFIDVTRIVCDISVKDKWIGWKLPLLLIPLSFIPLDEYLYLWILCWKTSWQSYCIFWLRLIISIGCLTSYPWLILWETYTITVFNFFIFLQVYASSFNSMLRMEWMRLQGIVVSVCGW
jgi:hypothetical protein